MNLSLRSTYRTDPTLTARERAALGLTEALADGHGEADLDRAHETARVHLTEREVAEVTAIATAEHFFDPATGRLGQTRETPND
jgi:alkylhydroperoxidase family enzyme